MKHLFQKVTLAVAVAAFIFYSCKKETSCAGCINGNRPPIAVAGSDQNITLPIDSISLDGSASNDPDGTITQWLWEKISGPAFFNIMAASSVKPKVKDLGPGTYQFELKVTDDKGLSAKDTVQIMVNATSHPPFAHAGPDQTIILGIVSLDGSGSWDLDNDIAGYQWTNISGPSSFTISNANTVQTQVTNLVEGIYEFELKVTDAEGLFSRDTVQVLLMPDSGETKVYIAGRDNAGNAALWKNGVVQTLPDGGFESLALSVFVSKGNVHVVGLEPNGSLLGADALYWKNGILQNFGEGYPASVFVSGNDVYVAGGILWKNGIAQDIGNFWPYYVYVSGNDVYLAGYDPGGSGVVLWKNGILHQLGKGDPTSIFVYGSDVYITGSVDNFTSGNRSAVLWKNGIMQNLGQGRAGSVFVAGSDVYVVGTKDGAATLWKNGVAENLGPGSAYSVFVSGGKVYVAGKKGVATLWIDGIENTLVGLTEAYSIFVQ